MKFCGICGAQLDDNASVCGACGAMVEAPTVPVAPVAPAASISKSLSDLTKGIDAATMAKIKKIALPAVAGVAGFIALIIIISAIAGNTGCKGAVKKAMNAFCKEDHDKVVEMVADMRFDDLDDREDYEEYFLDTMDEKFEDYKDSVGNELKVKYDIISIEDISDRKFDKLVETYDENDDYTGEIEAVKQVELEITIKGKKRDRDWETDDLYMVKEDGKWKICYWGDIDYIID